MAEVTGFSYQPGRSILHALDARFKLMFLAILSLTSLKAESMALLVLSGALFILISNACLSLRSILKELRYFFLLLAVVFVARALVTPGTIVFSFSVLTVTRQGLFDGILVCWRLLLVVLLGLSFMATTRPTEIRAAVEWYLKPIPAIPARRIGTMFGLITRFIPVILSQARETVEAQRARGIENRVNPLYRLTRLGIPLLRRTFESADRLIVAMESRCYSENRTGPVLRASNRDWVALIVIVASGALMLLA